MNPGNLKDLHYCKLIEIITKPAPTSSVELCALGDDKFISSFFSCLWDSVNM